MDLASITSTLQEYGNVGYAVIFFLVFCESIAFVGFVSPGIMAMLVAGAFAARGVYSPVLLYTLIALATMLGNLVSYEFGRHGKRYLQAHPRLWHHVSRALIYFEGHGKKSLFLGHYLGFLRHLIPLAAGVLGMKRVIFYLTNFFASLLSSLVYLGLGYFFGQFLDTAVIWIQRSVVTLGMLAVAAIYLYIRWRRFKKAQQTANPFFRSTFTE